MRPGAIELAQYTGGGRDDPNSPQSLLIGAHIPEQLDLPNEPSPRFDVRTVAPLLLILYGELDHLVRVA